MDGGEVIRIHPGAEKLEHDAPVTTRPRDRSKGFCQHARVELDTDVRRVYCRDCGDEVPAFDHLLWLARHFERYVSRVKEAKREAEMRERSLEEVKREERNAKARLRRVRSRLGD